MPKPPKKIEKLDSPTRIGSKNQRCAA